ncbi:hypothetical protein [Sphingobium sp.]|uniref:hypothetical protein n=1 Tax=Sphingobium sp. TaxID=1912891 RepID=UPI0035C6BC77
MVEDGGKSPISVRDPLEPDPPVDRPRGSLVIFLLVAIALILAIGFFYMTKDRNDNQADALIDSANSADSAVHVVGDAARNAADTLRKRD